MSYPSMTEAATTLWRTISTTLMNSQPRAALFVSGERGDGEVEAAFMVSQAAVQEGFSAVLVVPSNTIPKPSRFRRRPERPVVRTLEIGGHTLEVRAGTDSGVHVLELEFAGNFMRTVVTNNDSEQKSDLRDLLLRELGNSYDFAILAASNALTDPYALLFADRVPGVVMVARSTRSRIDDAARLKAVLEAAGGNLMGAILTHRRYYLPAWIARRL